MSNIVKARYTILQPGLRARDLDTIQWVDVEIAAEVRRIDHHPDAPDFVPTYQGIKRILQPMFEAGRNFEHVSVNGLNGPADMFVDDMGMLDGMAVNEAATAIYWTAPLMHVLAKKNPSLYERRTDAVQRAALAEAVACLERNQIFAPCIHGPAVLFDGRIWF